MPDDNTRIRKGLTRRDSRTKSNRMALNEDKYKDPAVKILLLGANSKVSTGAVETGLINSTPRRDLGALPGSELLAGSVVWGGCPRAKAVSKGHKGKPVVWNKGRNSVPIPLPFSGR